MFAKYVPTVTFLIQFLVASIVDKKLRISDRIAAMIPFTL